MSIELSRYRKQFDAAGGGDPNAFWLDEYVKWLEKELDAAHNQNTLHEATIASMRDEIKSYRGGADGQQNQETY